MKRIDTTSAVPDKNGPGKTGFQDGDLAVGVLPTAFNADWPNNVQEELASIVEAAGLVLSGADFTQVLQAIRLLTKGRVVRRSVYTLDAGVQYVSVNGGAPTTVGASIFVPIIGTAYVIAEAQGGGGGGGGATNPAAGNASLGGPGKSGGYGKAVFLLASIGASVPITVGGGGVGVSGAAGTSGGTSSVGSLLTGAGGTAGGILNNQTPPTTNGNGGTVTATGANLFSAPGTGGFPSTAISAALGAVWGGSGGGTVFGPPVPQNVGNANGLPATTIGGGGSGVVLLNGGGTATGGNGAPGIVIIEEFA